MTEDPTKEPDYGPRRLTVEVLNICNLHCSYCLRDEDALYHSRAEFMPVELFRRIVRDAKDVAGITEVNFTGGEPTLHPDFTDLIAACGNEGIKSSFVTNGWNFEQLSPRLLDHRDYLTHVAFSIDGITAAAHDRWRGQGSFVRLIRAFTRCQRHGMPFIIKVGIRRDTAEHLEQMVLFAARLGAAALSFAHIMPTSETLESNAALTLDERRRAEEEIALLARIFKMKVTIDVGYYNIGKDAPCAPLAAASLNVDYRGRLTLCCNLSGFRGGNEGTDIIADLRTEDFVEGYRRFAELREAQLQRRRQALEAYAEKQTAPDLYTGSPCLFCLKSFGKLPWIEKPSSPIRLVSPATSIQI